MKCGLSTKFQDVLAYFGSRDLEVEVAAPRLRFTPLGLQPSRRSWASFGMVVLLKFKPKLNEGVECTYGLRFVELNGRSDPRRMYSLRQMAICNNNDIEHKLATWVLVSPPPHVMLSISEHVQRQNLAVLNEPFYVHLLLFNFAIGSWRPYLVHLTQEVHQHVSLRYCR